MKVYLPLLFIQIISSNVAGSNVIRDRFYPRFEGSCTVYLIEARYDHSDRSYRTNDDSGISLSCATPDGQMYKVPSMDQRYIEEYFIDGPFKSGYAELVIDSNADAALDEESGTMFVIPSNVHLREMKQLRKLTTKTTGIKTLLVVRVVAADGATTASMSELSDSVFGTYGDSFNLASQYSACSHNKLNFVPAKGAKIINGVREVTISTFTSDGDAKMNNAILQALGKKPYRLADHLMFCLPPGTMKYAYATINGPLSVYDDAWCTYPSPGMHEIGHNLGLGHSSDGGDLYGDQSGLMGYGYTSDDYPRMCFNAAKSWQLGWYSSRTLELRSEGEYYAGDLVSITQDPDNTSGAPMLIKLNTPSAQDYFLSFNRATSFNIDTKDGRNRVRIVRTNQGSGTSYSVSSLEASLNKGSSWTSAASFDGGASAVVIVNTISATAAHIQICIGSCAPISPPTLPPTLPPTAHPAHLWFSPTPLPTNSPTDVHSGLSSVPTLLTSSPTVSSSSSPSLVIASPSIIPSAPLTNSPSVEPSYFITPIPSSSPTSFTPNPTSAPSVETAFPSLLPTSSSTHPPTITPSDVHTSTHSSSPSLFTPSTPTVSSASLSPSVTTSVSTFPSSSSSPPTDLPSPTSTVSSSSPSSEMSSASPSLTTTSRPTLSSRISLTPTVNSSSSSPSSVAPSFYPITSSPTRATGTDNDNDNSNNDCINLSTFTFIHKFSRQRKTCEWITMDEEQIESRRRAYCTTMSDDDEYDINVSIAKACPQACGLCIVIIAKDDDPQFTFQITTSNSLWWWKMRRTVGCDWISQKPESAVARMAYYCKREDVAAACAATCSQNKP